MGVPPRGADSLKYGLVFVLFFFLVFFHDSPVLRDFMALKVRD